MSPSRFRARLFGPVLAYDLVRTARRGTAIAHRCLYALVLFSALYLVFAAQFPEVGLTELFDGLPIKDPKTEMPKEVAALPPEKQVEAVAAKLKERNPGFDGSVMHKIERGVVTKLTVVIDNVTDITPVRALTGLRELTCNGSGVGKGKLSDLSPLLGMKLIYLGCVYTNVSDLSPLKDMPLQSVNCNGTPLADLSPLKDIPLTSFGCSGTKVSDLSPLRGMPLKVLMCDFKPERDSAIVRSIKTLEKINDKPAAEFWKEVDAKKP